MEVIFKVMLIPNGSFFTQPPDFDVKGKEENQDPSLSFMKNTFIDE